MITRNKDYYKEFLTETYKIIREQDQSTVASEIVREIESHRSGLEEKEERTMRTDLVGDMTHNALTEAISGLPIEEIEEMEKVSMEDKLIMSREEEYPHTRELTPGEISHIVNKALRDLPESLLNERGSEIFDTAMDIAYEVMHQLNEV